MKKIFCTWASILLLLFSLNLAAQDNVGILVKMDGYIINLGGEIIFQPCEDSTINVWKAMDKKSFGIWCNQFVDQYCEAIENIGDSLMIEVLKDSGQQYPMRMSFFYCSIEMYMAFIGNNKNDFTVFNYPEYQVLYKGKKYPLKGFFVRGYVKKILPYNKKDIRSMYNYYRNNQYPVPQWLDDEIIRKSSKKISRGAMK